MRDLVSYNEKHNEANGEGNNDGESHNRGWNCGVEGPTDDPAINALRSRQQRNLISTLMLSQGVPMMLGGDEIGRTQGGNNNAYCQDNEVSWYDWEHVDTELNAFVSGVIALRREHPTFRRRQFFQGRALHGAETADLAWFTPEAREMTDQEWGEGGLKNVMIFLGGGSIEQSARGEQITDVNVLWLMNADSEDVDFVLPDATWGTRWRCVLDTETGEVSSPEAPEIEAGGKVRMTGRSLMLLVHVDDE